MPERQPIDRAADVFSDLFDSAGDAGTAPVERAFAAVRAFERVLFDIPDVPDADGFLFEYGTFGFSGPPVFAVGFTRQLANVDESYTQARCELSYDPSEALSALGKRTDWWFRDSGTSFEEWLRRVEDDPVWGAVRALTPSRVEIEQDEA